MNRKTIVVFGWNFVMKTPLHFFDVGHFVDLICVDVLWTLWCSLFWLNGVHEIRFINSVHSAGPWPIAIQLLYFHLILKRDNSFDMHELLLLLLFLLLFVLLSIQIRYWHIWLGLNLVLFLLRTFVESFYCLLIVNLWFVFIRF